MVLTVEREKKYAEIAETIGNTPLVPYRGSVPNGNRILVKREFDNPFGSHYDRVYLDLFRYHEEKGNISPGGKVLETSTGAAGVSFGGMGRLLGYDCFVALPAGGERARERAIIEQLPDADHLILTPAEEYVKGFPRFLKRFLPRHRDHFFLNHSMGKRNPRTGRFDNNEIALGGLSRIGDEVVAELGQVGVDYFFPAVGNGSSIVGIGRPLHQIRRILMGAVRGLWDEMTHEGNYDVGAVNDAVEVVNDTPTSIIPFETFQAAALFELIHPGEYEKRFGIAPGTLARHKLPGTSFQGIDFPHIRSCLEERLVDDVVLVSDDQMDRGYEDKTGRTDTKELVHWDAPIEGHPEFGRTTRAGINVALDKAREVEGKTMLVIGYDKSDRYDS